MRLRHIGWPTVLPILVVLIHTGTALAVSVTGGAIGFGPSNFGTADLIGDNFRFTTYIADAPGMGVCQICDTGTHSLNVYITSGDFGYGDSSYVVRDGTRYSMPRNQPGQLSLTGTFTVPPALRSQSLAVTAPFSLSGYIHPVGLERIDLQGSGVATVQFRDYHPGNGFLRNGVNYQFQPATPPAASLPPASNPPPSAPLPNQAPVSPAVPSTPVPPPETRSIGPPLALADVAAMHPSLLNMLRDCGMCAEVRDLGTMASGRRGVQLTPVNGGFLSGSVVAELDPDPAGGPARLVNPEPTTLLLLLPGTLWLVGRRLQQLRRSSV